MEAENWEASGVERIPLFTMAQLEQMRVLELGICNLRNQVNYACEHDRGEITLWLSLIDIYNRELHALTLESAEL